MGTDQLNGGPEPAHAQAAGHPVNSDILFEAAPAGILLLDDRLDIVAANPAAAALTGTAPSDLVGSQLSTLLHPDDVAALESVPRMSTPGQAHRREVRYRAGESWRWATAALTVHQPGQAGRQLLMYLQDVDDIKQAEAALRHAARHDHLTGAANLDTLRAYLTDTLDPANGSGPVSVVYTDLVNLDRLNDYLGYDHGNQVLVESVRRLREHCPSAFVARVGGASLVVVEVAVHVDAFAEHVLALLRAPIRLGSRSVHVAAVAGVATGTPGVVDGEQLLHHAATALFEARHRPTGGWVRASERTIQSADRRREVEPELRAGLERGEFTVFYQPVFALSSGTATAVEVLARWNHPRHGMLLPEVFRGAAESAGLLLPLARLLLEQACTAARAWPAHIRACVSIPCALLGNLAGLVEDVVAATGLPAARLQLELAMDSTVSSSAEAHEDLRVATALGAHVALANFGAGHAPFTRLVDTPVHVLKIGRQFVADCDRDPLSREVIASVVALAHAAGATSAASGVDRAGHLPVLTDLGCDVGQGVLLAPPLSAAAFGRFLAAGAAVPHWQPQTGPDAR